VGYTGGHTKNATYKAVCAGGTGHAEAVQVTYDSDKVSLEHILQVFWKLHRPTYQENPGSQYRSAVFFYTPEQEAIARAELQKLENATSRKIYTEITPANDYWLAEEYHQNYQKKNRFGSCRLF
jgi:peptide-methionine (S)-S-oxide reductase